MIWFRPKRGPIWTMGRAFHATIGAGAGLGAWALWGYEGLGWSALVLPLGFCWELATVRLAGPLGWTHRYGDVIDTASFACGWVLVALILGG